MTGTGSVTIWLIFVLAGIGAFLQRYSLIYLFGRVQMPELLLRMLRFIPPAVLAALVAPALFAPGGGIDLSLGNERAIAGLLAAIVAFTTRSMILTIAVGMGALWGLQAVM